MGVGERCRPCHSAAHCRHMERQPCLCHHHPCRGRLHCNCRCAKSITIAVAVAHCRRPWPLLLRLPLTIAAAVSVALPSAIAIAVAVALAVSHCRLRHHWPSQLPSPLAITITIAAGHLQELVLRHGKNCIQKIMQRMLTLFYFVRTLGGTLIKAG